MIYFRLVLVYTTFLTVLFFQSCQKENDENSATCSDSIQNQGETGVDCGGPCTSCTAAAREKAVNDYNDNYLASQMTNSGWTGNSTTCTAGSLPQTTHNKVLQRINYFRRLVGLNDNTTWDESKFPIYQEAALMMKANNSLSHNPPSNWKCWSQAGYNGAATSNLHIGSHSSQAITAFMQDEGAGNIDVGHRRWILFSPITQFSYGSTDVSMSLGVIGMKLGNSHVPPFIAYPPKDFIPQTLIFPRWSFSIPGADFSNASVSMTGPGGTVASPVISKRIGYGDNTIVWEPVGVLRNSNSDISYTVTVSGITNAPQSTYTYTTVIFKP